MTGSVYGYVRVSSVEQNEGRQLLALENIGVAKRNIFIDKQSGKDFERTSYQKLKSKLVKNDLLIIKSIDRLGRNYDMILHEWAELTKTLEVNIYVIDFPILNTQVEDKNLLGKFIADIVLQVLSFVAQNERENIRQRQAEGIRIAKQNGIHLGRPKYKLPQNFEDIVKKYHNKEITNVEAAKKLKMSRGTFLKYAKECK